ncbi:MAG TPA: radical SAM family heme chaperone HemW, partial [Gaiellales bacterium]|nr:radical SAM family heme chaperone HemW [Gaiellales bacterium]
MSVRHLYVHVPFCAHRCGYCDFVTVTGHEDAHAAYVDALLTELALHGPPAPETVYVGGGTPSLLADDLLARLLTGLPGAPEVTVECNPETITPAKARVLRAAGVNRISLGAQSFQPHLLETLERRARPETVATAVEILRGEGHENVNLDLMFGVPGQSGDDLQADIEGVLAHAPEHVSWYELEAKPGTRFAVHHGAELARQAGALEDHYETVVAALRGAGYRWYETANFCRPGRESRHNLGYWLGHDYLGVGVGAVSTLGLERRRNRPRLRPYLEACAAGRPAPAEVEELTASERGLERLMLGLRLDEPLHLNGLAALVDDAACDRLAA